MHDHLPYSEMQFFPKFAAFNLGWREAPKRRITSMIPPRRGLLTINPQLLGRRVIVPSGVRQFGFKLLDALAASLDQREPALKLLTQRGKGVRVDPMLAR